MGKRKKAGWLGVNKERGRSTKPMTANKLAIRWRQYVAKNAPKGLDPITDSFGTRLYPTPKDAPDIARMQR